MSPAAMDEGLSPRPAEPWPSRPVREDSQRETSNARPGKPPIASTVVPGSTETAFRTTGRSQYTSVPPAASRSSPSSVNRATPDTTTYSSSCPSSPSSCSSTISSPASRATYALQPNAVIPKW